MSPPPKDYRTKITQKFVQHHPVQGGHTSLGQSPESVSIIVHFPHESWSEIKAMVVLGSVLLRPNRDVILKAKRANFWDIHSA